MTDKDIRGALLSQKTDGRSPGAGDGLLMKPTLTAVYDANILYPRSDATCLSGSRSGQKHRHVSISRRSIPTTFWVNLRLPGCSNTSICLETPRPFSAYFSAVRQGFRCGLPGRTCDASQVSQSLPVGNFWLLPPWFRSWWRKDRNQAIGQQSHGPFRLLVATGKFVRSTRDHVFCFASCRKPTRTTRTIRSCSWSSATATKSKSR